MFDFPRPENAMHSGQLVQQKCNYEDTDEILSRQHCSALDGGQSLVFPAILFVSAEMNACMPPVWPVMAAADCSMQAAQQHVADLIGIKVLLVPVNVLCNFLIDDLRELIRMQRIVV